MIEKTWVINASPLILLGKINQLQLVDQLAASLIVPKSVFEEIAQGPSTVFTQRTLDWANDYIQPDIRVPTSILKWDIGKGESQVLAHCLQIQSSKAILDDANAQAHCIPLHGTLGIILRAKKFGIIAVAKPLIDQLVFNGSFLSADLIREALLKVGE